MIFRDEIKTAALRRAIFRHLKEQSRSIVSDDGMVYLWHEEQGRYYTSPNYTYRAVMRIHTRCACLYQGKHGDTVGEAGVTEGEA